MVVQSLHHTALLPPLQLPQVFLTMTPRVNAFFSMEAMAGLQWLRVFVCMVIVYAVVEVEKALVDPLLMPLIKPLLRWCEAHTPQWLSVDQPLSSRLARMCGRKALQRMDSQYRMQARGTFRRGGDKRKQQQEEVQVAEGSGDGGVAVEVHEGSGRQLEARQLSAVVERAHSGTH